jgi:hypothetical protein
MARQAADLFSRSSALTFGRRGDEWNRESFVKSEKEFDALAVVHERLGGDSRGQRRGRVGRGL